MDNPINNVGAKGIIWGVSLVFLLAFGKAVSAQAGLAYDIRLCGSCKTLQDFKENADTVVAPDFWNARAYVVNPVSREIRYFLVQRAPQSVGGSSAGFRRPGSGHTTDVTIGIPDSDVVQEIQEALTFVEHVLAEMMASPILADALEMPISADSVVEVLGQRQGLLRRLELQDAVGKYFVSWLRGLDQDAGPIVRVLAHENAVSGVNGDGEPVAMAVVFPDGSSVNVALSQIAITPSGRYTYKFEADQTSGHLENGQRVPFHQDLLYGFSAPVEYMSAETANILINHLDGDSTCEAEEESGSWDCEEGREVCSTTRMRC